MYSKIRYNMKDKYTLDDEYIIDENKFQKNGSLRQDSEFFNDEDYVVHDLISVKRIENNKNEDWEIYRNKTLALILKGTRFTSKEKSFFRNVDGVKYIIDGYKKGWKSVSDFKKNLKGLL